MAVSIQGKMARGAFWMMLLNFTERGLGLINMVLLARLLVPADFGICAMAGSFILMAQMLTAFGFDIALIQNQSATESDYHTVWTFNVLVGVTILVLMLLLADPIAKFYKQPEIFLVVCALAFGPLILSLENIGVVAFRKDLDFRKEFRFQISRKLISFVVTVILALWLRTYWALVAGMLASRISGTVTSYVVHPFRPRFKLSGTSRIFAVSKWLLMHNILNYLREKSADFIIGRLSGPASLGIFNLSNELAHLPTNELAGPVNRALLPGFAKLTDAAMIQSAYANSVRFVSLATIPAACGILAVSPYLVPVVLGPKWLDGIALMEILSISGVFQVFHASMIALLVAKGFVRPVTVINAVFVAVLITSILLVVPEHGLIGAAYATLVVSVAVTPFFLLYIRSRLQIPMMLFARAITRPLIASLLMVVVVRLCMPSFSQAMPTITAMLWLLGGVVVGAATYMLTVLALWTAAGKPAGAEKLALEKIMLRIHDFRSKQKRS